MSVVLFKVELNPPAYFPVGANYVMIETNDGTATGGF